VDVVPETSDKMMIEPHIVPGALVIPESVRYRLPAYDSPEMCTTRSGQYLPDMLGLVVARLDDAVLVLSRIGFSWHWAGSFEQVTKR
jgi:hypothetical protein